MTKRLRLVSMVTISICLALILGCGGSKEAERQAKVLSFSNMTVKTDTRTGFFGGRYASFEVNGSVTNNTDNPVNKDNIPAVVWDGDNAEKVKADITQDKLLPGETCDVSWKKELSIKGSSIPELSFSGSFEFTGLDEVTADLNNQLQEIAGKYAADDAEKEEAKRAEEQEKADAAKKTEDAKAALTECKGKTAYEALAAAQSTDFEPRFEDSYEVDVTDDVKQASKDSELGSALVTDVQIEDESFFWDASVTFKLDYVDPAAKKERDDKAAADAAKKKADEEVKVCKGKTADEALALAEKSSYTPSFRDSYDVNVTDDVKDSTNGSAVHDAPVVAVQTDEGGWFFGPSVTFVLDYVDPEAEAQRQKEAAEKAAKEQAAKDLENCVGKTASYARKNAREAGFSYQFLDPKGNDITSDADDKLYLGARKRAKVTKVEVGPGDTFTFSLDKPLAMARKDNADLQKLLTLGDNFNPYVAEFASNYRGKRIEFNGCFSFVDAYETSNGVTYTILVEAMDFDPNKAIGPTFQFRDMTASQLNWVPKVPDAIETGQNVHVIAELGQFNETNGLYQLRPLQVSLR